MRRSWLGWMSASLTLAALVFAAGTSAPAGERTLVGTRVEAFELRDFHGNRKALADFADSKLVVVAFIGNDCPLVKAYAPRLAKLSTEYADRGVAFVGINSNVQDLPTEIAHFAQKYELDFPVLKDAGNVVADQLGATRTPEVFVLDRDRVVRYHGRVDDQFAVGIHRTKPTRDDLSSALDELLAGEPVSVATTEAPGCYIGRVRKEEPKGDITYATHVAAIFNKHCVECHREGELAPFPLTTYEDALGWTETIREVVSEGRMPPWFADPKYGVWANDCSMSDDEKHTLFTWIDNGAPQGDLAKLPTPPTFTDGWKIGVPDAVYAMKEPYTVPAEGTIEYQHFTIDPHFTEDKWISAAEARPGNTSVVHHVVLFLVSANAPDLNGSGSLQQLGGGAGAQILALYAPGMPAWKYPAGSAMKVPKGSKFVLQMHYTASGREETDISQVGLKFVDAKDVKQVVRNGMAVNFGFEIPPHADNHAISATTKFRKDTLLLQLFPHMHYRGKSFRIEAIYPDGTQEVLLDVPHYDFNWQLRYDMVQPKFMPKGTKMVCTGYFDNSENNPRNPNPDETVRFGLQSFEEMMVGYYSIIRVDDDPHAKDKDDSEEKSKDATGGG